MHVFFFLVHFDKLFWPETPLLESVGAHEPQVDSLRDSMTSAMQCALIPLKAYAAMFEPHLELFNTNIKEYIQYVISLFNTCLCTVDTLCFAACTHTHVHVHIHTFFILQTKCPSILP